MESPTPTTPVRLTKAIEENTTPSRLTALDSDPCSGRTYLRYKPSVFTERDAARTQIHCRQGGETMCAWKKGRKETCLSWVVRFLTHQTGLREFETQEITKSNVMGSWFQETPTSKSFTEIRRHKLNSVIKYTTNKLVDPIDWYTVFTILEFGTENDCKVKLYLWPSLKPGKCTVIGDVRWSKWLASRSSSFYLGTEYNDIHLTVGWEDPQSKSGHKGHEKYPKGDQTR